MGQAMNLPPLQSVRVFEAVARLGGATAATSELHISQSAVSHHIRQLEKRLGVQLFVRGHRGMSLTTEGRTYYEQVHQALSILSDATTELVNSEEEIPVVVGAPPILANLMLVPSLTDFWKKSPYVRVQIVNVGVEENADFEGVDLSVRYGRPAMWPSCHADYLFSGVMAPVCSPKYAVDHGLPGEPSAVLDGQLLHEGSFEIWRQWSEAVGLSNAFSERGPVFNNSTLLLAAALNGHGVALFATEVIHSHLDDGSLVQISDATINEELGFYLASADATSSRRSVEKVRRWLFGRLVADKERAMSIKA